MCRLMLEAARAAPEIDDVNIFFSLSTTNELYREFPPCRSRLFPVDTFRSAPDVLLKALRIFRVRRQLIRWLRQNDIKSVVVLMPHIWTPLIGGAIKREGIHYATVVHDAKPHPGDPTALFTNWLLNDARAANTVFTLSDWVARQLIEQGTVPPERIKTLFMPDVLFPVTGHTDGRRQREKGQPLRVLFFGRMLQYKGLHLFAEAMEILAREKVPIKISVCGEGDLGRMSVRLANLGAAVKNRWLSDAELGQLLASHDLVALTHTEASQSGAIAAALGAGVPVVTTPVGGLADQVRSRGAGLVAERVDARAIADCVRVLASDSTRYNAVVDQICSNKNFSAAHFVRELLAALPVARSALHSA